MRQGHGYDSWWTEKVDTAISAISAITRNIDRSVWRDLMLKSGMISLIDVIKRGKKIGRSPHLTFPIIRFGHL